MKHKTKVPWLKKIFSRQVNPKHEKLFSFALPLLIATAIISLPISAIKTERMEIAICIWLLAFTNLIFFSSLYIQMLKNYWNRADKKRYVNFWISFLLYTIGVAITSAIFPTLVTFEWLGIPLVILGYISLVTTLIITMILWFILWIFHVK